jgi:hypothetical protein
MFKPFKAFAWLGLLCLASCSEGSSKDPEAGGLRVELVKTPAEISCFVVSLEGSRKVTQLFPLPASGPSLLMTGLPFGPATVVGEAYVEPCDAIAGRVPAYLSKPTPTEIGAHFIAIIQLLLLQNGQAGLNARFEGLGLGGADDGAGGAAGGAATGGAGAAAGGTSTGGTSTGGLSGTFGGFGGSAPSQPEPPVARSLSLKVTGSGSVSIPVDPPIVCSGTCTASFAQGSKVTLAVQTGTFDFWKGSCAVFEILPRCQLVMDQDRSVEAVFKAGQPQPNPNPNPQPVELRTWNTAITGSPLTVPSTGSYQMKVSVSTGPTSGQMTIRRNSPPSNPIVESVSCQVSAALDPPCSAQRAVALNAGESYLVDFLVTNLRTGGSTIGGTASLLE